VKLTKSQIKEIIKQSIDEIMSEGDDKKPEGPKQAKTDIMDNPFDEEEKDEVEEGGPGSGRPTKPGSKRDIEKRMDKAVSDANAKLDAAEKAAKKKKKRKRPKGGDVGGPAHPNVKESKGKRCTVKEVKKWMKTLEENRYKKTYQSDCRRVAWFVNHNLSEDYESMPISMRKKWTKAQYGRERFLAKEFIKHLESKQMNEQRLRKVIRGIIKQQIRG